MYAYPDNPTIKPQNSVFLRDKQAGWRGFLFGGFMEIWKSIENYEEYYQVSNYGKIRSLNRTIIGSREHCKLRLKGQIIKMHPDKQGYLHCGLHKEGKMKTVRIHRMVAKAFIPNPGNKPEINHKNGIKKDNTISNLEWVTGSENVIDAYSNGLMSNRNGKNNGRARAVIQMDMMGNMIKKYDCIRDAARELGINWGNIYSVCRKRYGCKTSGGFKWRYDDLEIAEA